MCSVRQLVKQKRVGEPESGNQVIQYVPIGVTNRCFPTQNGCFRHFALTIEFRADRSRPMQPYILLNSNLAETALIQLQFNSIFRVFQTKLHLDQ